MIAVELERSRLPDLAVTSASRSQAIVKLGTVRCALGTMFDQGNFLWTPSMGP